MKKISLIFIALVLTSFASAHIETDSLHNHELGGMMYGGMGFFSMLIFWILIVLVIVAIVLLIILLIKKINNAEENEK